MFKSTPQTRKSLLVSSDSYCAMIRNMSRCSDEHMKMQIAYCQYFSRGGRVREDLQKINVKVQHLLLVTSNMMTLLMSKTLAK